MNDESWILKTIEPKSDQLNADDLLSGPITAKVVAVKRGTTEQPVALELEGYDGRPYKPCKSMRRVLVSVWGDRPADWVGKSLTLYCDPEVRFGGMRVGGIRISHMSGIENTVVLGLTVTRGKRGEYKVEPLKVQVASKPASDSNPDPARAAEDAIAKARTLDELDALEKRIKASDKFDAGTKASLQELVSIRAKDLT